MLVNQPGDQRFEAFSRFAQNELVLLGGPIELEARGQGRDPDLVYRGIRRNDELRRRVVEAYVKCSERVLHLEIAVFFRGDQGLFQRLQ